jgi:hypothetical protein
MTDVPNNGADDLLAILAVSGSVSMTAPATQNKSMTTFASLTGGDLVSPCLSLGFSSGLLQFDVAATDRRHHVAGRLADFPPLRHRRHTCANYGLMLMFFASPGVRST